MPVGTYLIGIGTYLMQQYLCQLLILIPNAVIYMDIKIIYLYLLIPNTILIPKLVQSFLFIA